MSADIPSILPEKVRSIADMAGVLGRIDGLENVLVLIEDDAGVLRRQGADL